MFQVDDYVICRSGGIWRVTAINGDTLALARHESEQTKQLPQDSEEIARKICSKEKALEVIDRVGFIPTIQAPTDKKRNELYEASLAMFDEVEWVRVVKSVYLRGEHKALSPAEEAYGKLAKDFLHGEISVLLEMPAAQVERHITVAVENDAW